MIIILLLATDYYLFYLLLMVIVFNPFFEGNMSLLKYDKMQSQKKFTLSRK